MSESGGVRTVFVFLDLPVHYEFRAGPLPLLEERSEIVFEQMTLKNPKDLKRDRTIEGAYVIERRILRFGASRPGFTGMTQYLEMKVVM